MNQSTVIRAVRTAYAETHIAADVVSTLEVFTVVRSEKDFAASLPVVRHQVQQLEQSLQEALVTVRALKKEVNQQSSKQKGKQ